MCSVKKNESALERIRGHQGEMQIHPRKMEVYQIKKNAVEWKPIKLKKKKKELAWLKTQKGRLGKN